MVWIGGEVVELTTYGNATSSDYIVAISTGNAGTPPAPSGDISYLWAESIDGDISFKHNTKHVSGNNHYSVPDGANQPMVNISNSVILKKTGDTSKVVTFNDLTEFLTSLQDLGNGPAYLWITMRSESDNIQLGYETTTSTDYMKGYIRKLKWSIQKTTLVINKIQFERSD